MSARPTPGWLGCTHVDLEVCDSTNDEASRLAAGGCPHGAVVTARAQRAGRGRRGRTWHSPPDDNLYYSCVLRPELHAREAPPITLAAGLGVADCVARFIDAKVGVKWPNDVLVGSRKIAGVLTETSVRGARLEHVIVGIGINVATREFPEDLRESATSMALESDAPVAREQLIATLNQCLEVWFDRLLEHGGEYLSAAWMQRARHGDYGLGRVVCATMGKDQLRGRIVGLDPDGRLRVLDEHGREHVISAGAVEYCG